MEYKGYLGEITFDKKTRLFYGKVSNIKDPITFQGKSIETLRYHFQDAVNEYITWCHKQGKSPDSPSNDNLERNSDQDNT